MVHRLGLAGEVIHTIVLCALTLGRSAHPAKTAILYDSGAISDAYLISIAGITLITADFDLSVGTNAVDESALMPSMMCTGPAFMLRRTMQTYFLRRTTSRYTYMQTLAEFAAVATAHVPRRERRKSPSHQCRPFRLRLILLFRRHLRDDTCSRRHILGLAV